MTQEITVTKTEDHYEMQFEGNDTAYPVPNSAIDKLDDDLTPAETGDPVTFVGEYGGHKHMKNFDVEEVLETPGGEDDEDDDDAAGRDGSAEPTEEHVEEAGHSKAAGQAQQIEAQRLFEDTESDDGQLMTDGGERNECAHCDAYHAPEAGIVTGKPEVGDDRTCNICLQDYLRENTVLSRRESEVAALKLLGYRHETIAELLQAWRGEDKPTKSTVDEYSRRMNEKVGKAAATVDSLDRFL